MFAYPPRFIKVSALYVDFPCNHFNSKLEPPLTSTTLSISRAVNPVKYFTLFCPGFQMAKFEAANKFGCILKENVAHPEQAVYAAGPLNDILLLRENFGTPFVASSTSGIWITGDGRSVSLSMEFDRADMNCLLKGPFSDRHLFAGGSGTGGEALWENTSSANFISWRRIPVEDASGHSLNCGTIWDMAVANFILVLACSNGLFWTQIQDNFPRLSFKVATDGEGNSLRGRFSAVKSNTLGTGSVFVAGQPANNGGARRGLLQGIAVLTGGNLVFTVSTLPQGLSAATMGMTALTSCSAAPGVFYAAVANFDGKVLTVLRSDPVGSTLNWAKTTATVRGTADLLFGGSGILAGTLLDRDFCIGLQVSPFEADTVLLGWQSAYFVLTASSGQWMKVDASSDHLRPGIHGFAFDPRGLPHNTIMICGDGGVAITPDLGKTHVSFFNRHLPNLQLCKGAVSDRNYGIVAGSFPKYGSLYCSLYMIPSEWKFIRGGEGQSAAFLRNGQLIDQSTGFVAPVTAAGIEERRFDLLTTPQWKQASGLLLTNATTPTPINAQVSRIDSFKLLVPMEPLETPTLKYLDHTPGLPQDLFGASLVGLAAFSIGIYGLWRGVDDKQMAWDLVGAIPVTSPAENITCLGSVDGFEIFVGTDQGNIYTLKPPPSPGGSWSLNPEVVNSSPLPDQIRQFCVHSDLDPFVIASIGGFPRLFTRTTGAGSSGFWEVVTGPSSDLYTAIESDWSPASAATTIFLSTAKKVFASTNKGATWTDISRGLPLAPHITDLRHVREPGGASYLCVVTFGWSIWRLNLTPGNNRSRPISMGGPGPGDRLSRIGIQNDRVGRTDHAIDLLPKTLTPLDPVQQRSWLDTNGTGSDALSGNLSARFELQADGSVDVKWITTANNAFSGHTSEQEGSVLLLPGDQSYNVVLLSNVEDTVGFNFWLRN
ncbi:hypothetical protein BGZ57DRAFT_130810, partial [Hyaloscypha finlandica]